jgi:hypothetical protein
MKKGNVMVLFVFAVFFALVFALIWAGSCAVNSTPISECGYFAEFFVVVMGITLLLMVLAPLVRALMGI